MPLNVAYSHAVAIQGHNSEICMLRFSAGKLLLLLLEESKSIGHVV